MTTQIAALPAARIQSRANFEILFHFSRKQNWLPSIFIKLPFFLWVNRFYVTRTTQSKLSLIYTTKDCLKVIIKIRKYDTYLSVFFSHLQEKKEKGFESMYTLKKKILYTHYCFLFFPEIYENWKKKYLGLTKFLFIQNFLFKKKWEWSLLFLFLE